MKISAPGSNMSMGNINERNAMVYDAHASEWCETMSENVGHQYLEKPAMEEQLPENLKEKSVLCIGVGSGEELGGLLKRGPRKVTGIDISEGLLQIAGSRFAGVKFEKMEMTQLDFPDENFDFIYSGLAFHYAKDWDVLLAEVNRVLKKSGELLFSTHHPIYWSRKPLTGNVYTNERGVTLSEHKALLHGNVEVVYYNHPDVESIRDALEHAGFQIQKLLEPAVVEVRSLDSLSTKEKYLELKKQNEVAPLFLIVRASK